MNLSLTPEVEQWIQDKVATGMYDSATEVVLEALRLLKEQDDDLGWTLEDLRREAQIGLDDIASGRVRAFDAEEMKRRVRASLAAEGEREMPAA